MLVTDLVNVRYLTGYTGSNGLALVGPRTRSFVTDFRYVEQAAEEVDPSFERRLAPRELLETAAEELPDGAAAARLRGRRTVGAPARRAARAAAGCGRAPRRRLARRAAAPGQGARGDRGHKSGGGRSPTRPSSSVIADGLVGRTEQEVALALEWEMRGRGGERSELRPDRGGRPPRSAAARPASRRADRRGGDGRDRLGCRSRRIPLGLHADGLRGRARRRRAGPSTSWCSRLSWPASGRSGRELIVRDVDWPPGT